MPASVHYSIRAKLNNMANVFINLFLYLFLILIKNKKKNIFSESFFQD